MCERETDRQTDRSRDVMGFFKGRNKFQIACHSENLSAVKLSKCRPVKCTRDKKKKMYEQFSVTLKEIEN